MITVISREETNTHNPFEVCFRHARMGLLAHLAEEAELAYETFGERASEFRASANNPRAKGSIARFLLRSELNHLTPTSA